MSCSVDDDALEAARSSSNNGLPFSTKLILPLLRSCSSLNLNLKACWNLSLCIDIDPPVSIKFVLDCITTLWVPANQAGEEQ